MMKSAILISLSLAIWGISLDEANYGQRAFDILNEQPSAARIADGLIQAIGACAAYRCSEYRTDEPFVAMAVASEMNDLARYAQSVREFVASKASRFCGLTPPASQQRQHRTRCQSLQTLQTIANGVWYVATLQRTLLSHPHADLSAFVTLNDDILSGREALLKLHTLFQ